MPRRLQALLQSVSVITSPEAEEAVSEFLQQYFADLPVSYTDVETRETTVTVYLSKQRFHPTDSRRGILAGLARIRNCGLNIAPGKVSFATVRKKDWAESWKRHFKPIEVGSALLIKPSWSRQRPRKNQACVVLDPGLSFGTGQHPTTAFCLAQVVARRKHAVRQAVLDIGTGSGILAISAAKLGYSPVHAFDFDPEAVRIARENARKNGVDRQIQIHRDDVTKLPKQSPQKYDLVCANLISTLLIAERQRIISRLSQEGILVVAGILKTEFRLVRRTFESAGLKLVASKVEKEWASAAFA